ncbi:MAG: hypothetical protein E7396_03360 [Ruminococcaceae bacterium]|nr:hypothetical protein [Oscillospiraceae bacterium]
MDNESTTNFVCKLCGQEFDNKEMSEEHYPARSTGNEDIVSLDIVKMIDSIMSGEIHNEILRRSTKGEEISDISENIFDTQLSKSLYPDGRTSRTLCKECNTFLGKYDEAYLKFFNVDGNPKIVKGFQQITKLEIIKAIYAKFLSLPESVDEKFDFLEFIKNKNMTTYNGIWKLYFVKRDFSSDLLGMKDIGTGKVVFDEGVVYEMSDDKFIFNLMNFEIHSCFNMTSIFDILKKNYTIIEGVGENGGYHAQILMSKLFSEFSEE